MRQPVADLRVLHAPHEQGEALEVRASQVVSRAEGLELRVPTRDEDVHGIVVGVQDQPSAMVFLKESARFIQMPQTHGLVTASRSGAAHIEDG